MLTVIIATLNRSRAIAEISLPSLLRQDATDFEVLIWDASEDGLTESAVRRRTQDFSRRGIALRYFRAPRKGSASQRNDAVKEAKGSVIFFIDDDSEVSPDGVSALSAAFAMSPDLKGAALPLFQAPSAAKPFVNKTVTRRLFSLAKTILRTKNGCCRMVRKSGINIMVAEDAPGAAEWLSGGSMAFHVSVFDELRFYERLERFGGYALGEDMDFSHRVLLHFRKSLLVVPSGGVTHYAVEGGRLDRVRMNAAIFYNSKIIRDNFNNYVSRYKLPQFLWEQRILRVLLMFDGGSSICEIIAGYIAYRKALREDADCPLPGAHGPGDADTHV